MARELKIGVINSNVTTAISISNILENNGYKTFQSYDIDDALNKSKDPSVRLVIIDTNLTTKKGIDNSEIAKKFSKQKIIFVSYSPEEEIKTNSKNVIAVIRKPVDINELLSFVNKVS